MAAPEPVLGCLEKYQLLRAFASAVSDHHRMQSAQLAAVLKGEDFPYEDEIAKSAARRENAKYAVLAHQQEHGC